jgi:hypothetical protein
VTKLSNYLKLLNRIPWKQCNLLSIYVSIWAMLVLRNTAALHIGNSKFRSCAVLNVTLSVGAVFA